MLGMEEPPELRENGTLEVAVWALRVGYGGLAVAVGGLIVLSVDRRRGSWRPA